MTWKKEKTEGYVLNKAKNPVQKYFSVWEMRDILLNEDVWWLEKSTYLQAEK